MITEPSRPTPRYLSDLLRNGTPAALSDTELLNRFDGCQRRGDVHLPTRNHGALVSPLCRYRARPTHVSSRRAAGKERCPETRPPWATGRNRPHGVRRAGGRCSRGGVGPGVGYSAEGIPKHSLAGHVRRASPAEKDPFKTGTQGAFQTSSALLTGSKYRVSIRQDEGFIHESSTSCDSVAGWPRSIRRVPVGSPSRLPRRRGTPLWLGLRGPRPRGKRQARHFRGDEPRDREEIDRLRESGRAPTRSPS